MYCNERIIGNCPQCGHRVKIAWTTREEALPEGGTHTYCGDTFKVTEKCEHIPADGGTAEGLDWLTDRLAA